MISTEKPLAGLTAAYALWHESKGEDPSGFLDLMDAGCTMRSVTDGVETAEFTSQKMSRAEAEDYFSQLIKEWKMVEYVVDRFVADDAGNIVMIGHFDWIYRNTGKHVTGLKVDCWTFNADGLATSFLEMFDSAEFLLATGYLKQAK